MEKALFKQFRKVSKNTHLGLASRILEKDNFLVIEESNDIVTRMDLLAFITKIGQQKNDTKKRNMTPVV